MLFDSSNSTSIIIIDPARKFYYQGYLLQHCDSKQNHQHYHVKLQFIPSVEMNEMIYLKNTMKSTFIDMKR